MPIEEPGKLHIDPLAKISIFFSMIHRNKNEMLSEVLTRLSLVDKIKETFSIICFIYICSRSEANKGAR